MEPSALEQVNVRRLMQSIQETLAGSLQKRVFTDSYGSRVGDLLFGLSKEEQRANAEDAVQQALQFYVDRNALVSTKTHCKGYPTGWKQLKNGTVIVSWEAFPDEDYGGRRKPRRVTRVRVKRFMKEGMGFEIKVQPRKPVEFITLTATLVKDGGFNAN